MKYFLGIDLGTSSVKSLLMDEEGSILGTTQQGYDIVKPALDCAEQDMELLWQSTVKAIQALLAAHPGIADHIEGIGYSGQMHGLVMVDARGKLIRNAIIWADQRSGQSIEDIYRMIPQKEYQQVTLNSLSTGFLISSLMWVRDQEPDIYQMIDKVMLPKDYLRYRMTGMLGTDMSDGSSALIFDTADRQWAWELIERLGLEKAMFVECHESYEIAGEITSECASLTGLREHTRVVYGGGDSLMCAIGNGMILPGVLSSNIGTASQLACIVDQPLHDPLYRTNTFCHVKEDQWMVMGANLSGGVSLKWLKNNILGMSSFDEMTALAGEVPAGSEGLLFLPYLSGERTPYNDPQAKGIYFGMTLKHTRAHLIRSTMEGIIFGMKNSLEIFQDMGIRFSRIVASGGGARGRLFREIQANMFGVEIYRSLIDEQACVGAAVTAAVGCGYFSGYEEAVDRVVKLSSDVVEPDREQVKIYQERFQAYKKLYPANQELFHLR